MGVRTIVKVSEENPEPTEIIAKSIIEIAEAVGKLENSRLKSRAIYLLIRDQTGLPLGEIERVLNAAADLKRDYIK